MLLSCIQISEISGTLLPVHSVNNLDWGVHLVDTTSALRKGSPHYHKNHLLPVSSSWIDETNGRSAKKIAKNVNPEKSKSHLHTCKWKLARDKENQNFPSFPPFSHCGKISGGSGGVTERHSIQPSETVGDDTKLAILCFIKRNILPGRSSK